MEQHNFGHPISLPHNFQTACWSCFLVWSPLFAMVKRNSRAYTKFSLGLVCWPHFVCVRNHAWFGHCSFLMSGRALSEFAYPRKASSILAKYLSCPSVFSVEHKLCVCCTVGLTDNIVLRQLVGMPGVRLSQFDLVPQNQVCTCCNQVCILPLVSSHLFFEPRVWMLKCIFLYVMVSCVCLLFWAILLHKYSPAHL